MNTRCQHQKCDEYDPDDPTVVFLQEDFCGERERLCVCVHKVSGLFFKCWSDLKLRSLSKTTKSGLNSVKMLTHHQF